MRTGGITDVELVMYSPRKCAPCVRDQLSSISLFSNIAADGISVWIFLFVCAFIKVKSNVIGAT